MIKSIKYNLYLIFHSKVFLFTVVGMVLFASIMTVLHIVDGSNFFNQMRESGVDVKNVAEPLDSAF